MLRLPKVELARPASVKEAVAVLAEHEGNAMILAGGTDLLPNLKHELYDVGVLVALDGIEGLRGIREEADGTLAIGAMTPLDDVATNQLVSERAPALAQAASLVAGPQHRRMGTLGGNVMLDTRCRWINQTYFWREALGFCLKKDGTLCHVVEGGKKCVAAASNDTAPALGSLGATLHLAGSKGARELAIDELWKPDGIFNKRTDPTELLVEVRVPRQAAGHRGAYGKLRDRGSIDFPLFGVAVRLDLDGSGTVEDADVVAVALQARPVHVKGASELLAGARVGTDAFEQAARAVAERAHAKCHPLDNVPGEAAWRRRMVPVYTRRTLLAAAAGEGPVHHL
jgi:4-hydroxybenzoyl-CoA reductase subunit beta